MIEYQQAKEISNHLRSDLIKNKGLIIEDDGATIRPKGKHLSKGCRACKSAAWICIYIGIKCNLKCEFCPQLSRHKSSNEYIWANGGDNTIHWKEDLNKVIKRNPQINGISFSGGEPFLYFDTLVEWIIYIHDNWPNIYLWMYTNGLLVTERKVKILIEQGLQEIRFDLAATKYSNKVIETMDLCKNEWGLKYLSAEVPVLPKLMNPLLKSLKTLDKIGLDYLNLHEIQIAQENKERLIKLGASVNLFYSNTRGSLYELGSIFNTYKIINYIEDHNLSIIYNDCSSRNYINQSLGFQLQQNNMDPQYNQEDWETFIARCRKENTQP